MLNVADIVDMQLRPREVSPGEPGRSVQVLPGFSANCHHCFATTKRQVSLDLRLVVQRLRLALLKLLVVAKENPVSQMKRLLPERFRVLSQIVVGEKQS